MTNPLREAGELYQKLRAVPQGDDKPWIQPWLDEEELFHSMDWNLEIEKAADTVLVCPSNNSSTRRKKRSVNVSHLLKRTWRYTSIWSPFVNL